MDSAVRRNKTHARGRGHALAPGLGQTCGTARKYQDEITSLIYAMT